MMPTSWQFQFPIITETVKLRNWLLYKTTVIHWPVLQIFQTIFEAHEWVTWSLLPNEA